MNRRFHTFVALVALFLLPLQALASASMLFCGHIGDHRAHRAVWDGAHDENQALHLGDAFAHVDGDHDSVNDLKHVADACNGCTACCCPAAATLGFCDPVDTDNHPDLIPYVERPFSGVVPDRLDRPPRTDLV